MKKELSESIRPQKMSLPDWGWGEFYIGSVEKYEVPGDQISMVADIKQHRIFSQFPIPDSRFPKTQ
ncbi:MAG: hypothetical protein F6J98_30820 [Moorea sp. SIO4G2]|nr:hypothetical protein [Moorena sp. SIO4G2]